VLQRGRIVVQVFKEPWKAKGVRVTTRCAARALLVLMHSPTT